MLDWYTEMVESGIDTKNLVKEYASLKAMHSEHKENSKKTILKLEDNIAHL